MFHCYKKPMSLMLLQIISITLLVLYLTTLIPPTNCLNAKSADTNAYCDYNETYEMQVPVRRTRLLVKKPTGFFKAFKKTTTQEEEYTDLVPEQHVRLVSGCCAGYQMSNLKICEPICEHGCPTNAFCKERNLCQCRRGYTMLRIGEGANATHQCEALCEPNCPAHASCIEPGVCECEFGYYMPQSRAGQPAHQCVPRCTSNCTAPANRCIAPDICLCAPGYVFPENDAENVNGCVPEVSQTTKDLLERDDWINTSEDIDSSTSLNLLPEEFGSGGVALQSRFSVSEIIAGSGADVGGGSGSGDGNVELFPSSIGDCPLQPCVGDVVCKLIDLCACADGFVWHQPAPEDGVEMAPICAALITDHPAERTSNWLGTFFIAVGVAVIVAAFVVLLIKLLLRKRGKMDVGGKNELCCKYDKRVSSLDNGQLAA